MSEVNSRSSSSRSVKASSSARSPNVNGFVACLCTAALCTRTYPAYAMLAYAKLDNVCVHKRVTAAACPESPMSVGISLAEPQLRSGDEVPSPLPDTRTRPEPARPAFTTGLYPAVADHLVRDVHASGLRVADFPG